MNRATPQAIALATHLLRFEATAGKRVGRKATAATRACEKLHGLLSAFLGSAGFRALLARALTLAKAEAPGLGAVHLNADGGLEGLEEAEPHAAAANVAKDEVILVAHVLGLLVVFIGEALTLRLVQDAWPKVTVDHFYSDEGEEP